jgi:hypothetical protein
VRKRRLAAIIAVFAAAALAVYEGWVKIPPNIAPWRPVDLAAAPGWLAHPQLNSLAADGDACRAALMQAGQRFTILADRSLGQGCGFHDVVRLSTTPIAFSPQPTATCGMAAALTWYQQRVDAAARAILGSPVVRIDQLGTYACRNINWAESGGRSQHATANAIDIAAFHLADGRVVSVLADYGKPTPAGRFLDAAHDEACGLFNIVLGPKYNRLHANHFHVDMGPFRFCR